MLVKNIYGTEVAGTPLGLYRQICVEKYMGLMLQQREVGLVLVHKLFLGPMLEMNLGLRKKKRVNDCQICSLHLASKVFCSYTFDFTLRYCMHV